VGVFSWYFAWYIASYYNGAEVEPFGCPSSQFVPEPVLKAPPIWSFPTSHPRLVLKKASLPARVQMRKDMARAQVCNGKKHPLSPSDLNPPLPAPFQAPPPVPEQISSAQISVQQHRWLDDILFFVEFSYTYYDDCKQLHLQVG
jgi:hypothetical protein